MVGCFKLQALTCSKVRKVDMLVDMLHSLWTCFTAPSSLVDGWSYIARYMLKYAEAISDAANRVFQC
jgi:hypothetical protein